jgi:hypothetical protein
MYSGTTLTRFSGRVLGAHQKIDRVARDYLQRILPDNSIFPTSRQILHFEGRKGPDAIKRKSPAKDEPWHYYNPFDADDSQLIELIEDHYQQLVKELRAGNLERSAFEAAWIAHALVDGLTPPHHYPYEKRIEEIWGDGKHIRTTLRKKWFPPADTARERLQKSWEVWGPKGLITTHGLFELGAAVILAPASMAEARPTKAEIAEIRRLGTTEWFKQTAQEVTTWDIYERYLKKGWTTKLAYDIRHKLGPTMSKTVCLTWYCALVDAELVKPEIRI